MNAGFRRGSSHDLCLVVLKGHKQKDFFWTVKMVIARNVVIPGLKLLRCTTIFDLSRFI